MREWIGKALESPVAKRAYDEERALLAAAEEPGNDTIDPSEWGRLVSYLRTLPRYESTEPRDVEPFV